MKGLSDWQLVRLRHCLQAYHACGTGQDFGVFNWKDVSEAIAEYTDAKIAPERLRQFVEGINDGQGGRKYPVPKAIDAIWQFATHDELQLISEEELTERRPAYQAALRLLDYLDQDFDTERIMPPESVRGTYRSRASEEDEVVITELVIESPATEGLISVAKTDEYFDEDAEPDLRALSRIDTRELRNQRLKYSGWAILTPEDNLVFFFKNERNGANQYYFTLASDLDRSAGMPVFSLHMLRHEYPLAVKSDVSIDTDAETLEVVNDTREEVRAQLAGSMSDFYRYS